MSAGQPLGDAWGSQRMPHIFTTTGPVASMPGASRHASGGMHDEPPQAIAPGVGGLRGAAGVVGGVASSGACTTGSGVLAGVVLGVAGVHALIATNNASTDVRRMPDDSTAC